MSTASTAETPKSQQPTQPTEPRPEPKILFQKFFKSVGPRTYAGQVKEASNGNHFIVLTEGRRDDKTGEVRKTRLLVFSEDFDAFFDLVEQMGRYVNDNPVPEKVRKQQEQYWKNAAKRNFRAAKT